MENKEILDLMSAGAAVLPLAVVALRRGLSLRTAEVLHAVAAVLLVTAAASAIFGLAYGGALVTFNGPGSDRNQALVWAVLGAGFAAGIAAWWLLHARPRTVAVEEPGYDDDAVEPEPEPEPEPDAGPDVVSDLPPTRTAGRLVPRTLFLGVGLALAQLLPFRNAPGHGQSIDLEAVLLAVLVGLIASFPLLAAVFADDDDSPDGPAYVGFALIVGALLAHAFLSDVSPNEYEIVVALLAGLTCGILAPAALDVLGDLTSAVRPYAIPVGIAVGGALLALSVVLTQRAVFASYEESSALGCTAVQDC